MKKAFEISVPARKPQVSRFSSVLCCAIVRKRWRRSGGKKRVRSGLPFSRYAEGLKVYVDETVGEDEGAGEEGPRSELLYIFGGMVGTESGRGGWLLRACVAGFRGTGGGDVRGASAGDFGSVSLSEMLMRTSLSGPGRGEERRW